MMTMMAPLSPGQSAGVAEDHIPSPCLCVPAYRREGAGSRGTGGATASTAGKSGVHGCLDQHLQRGVSSGQNADTLGCIRGCEV